MKPIKRYYLLEYDTQTVDDTIRVRLEEGSIQGPYYEREHPKALYDTEAEAIVAACARNSYGSYLIVPHISFELP